MIEDAEFHKLYPWKFLPIRRGILQARYHCNRSFLACSLSGLACASRCRHEAIIRALIIPVSRAMAAVKVEMPNALW
jgi:hypothetical protein